MVLVAGFKFGVLFYLGIFVGEEVLSTWKVPLWSYFLRDSLTSKTSLVKKFFPIVLFFPFQNFLSRLDIKHILKYKFYTYYSNKLFLSDMPLCISHIQMNTWNIKCPDIFLFNVLHLQSGDLKKLDALDKITDKILTGQGTDCSEGTLVNQQVFLMSF